MTIPLESTVDSTEEDNRHFLMRVPMRITHVAALVNQHVIQNVAVALGNIPQLLAEVRQVLDVIPVYLGIVGLVRRNVAVVRRTMPSSLIAGFGETGAGKVAGPTSA